MLEFFCLVFVSSIIFLGFYLAFE